MLRPDPILKKGLLFASLPLLLIAIDCIDPATGGKIALYSLTGSLFFGYAAAWLGTEAKRRPDRGRALLACRRLVLLAFFVLAFGLLFFSFFEAALRTMFGVRQDSFNVMNAIFSTDMGEAKEFIDQYGAYLLGFTGLFAVFGAFFLWLYSRPAAVASVIPVLVSGALFGLLHINDSLQKGNPYVYFYRGYVEFQKNLDELKALKTELEDGEDAAYTVTSDGRPNTLVLVIGESDTRYNWHLYGYPRQTTPQIETLRDKILTFTDATSGAPDTITSFQLFMTRADKEHPDLYKSSPDLLTVARRAGYKTFFLSNHSTDNRSVIGIFASHADKLVLANRGNSRGEGSFDEALFGPYAEALADPAPRKFIIVHLLGSHPAYNFRYPDGYGKFTYTFDDEVARDLSAKGRAKAALAFRNFYDNSVLYGDFVRTRLLRMLMENKAEDKSWLYFSDHGQDVSHTSNYSGHNYMAPQQWAVPLIFWSSRPERFSPGKPILGTRDGRPVDLAKIDHTILGIMGIGGTCYDPESDLFRTGER